MKNFFFRVVSHNAENIFRVFQLEYLPQIAKEIKIILNYHSVGPKEEFDEKKRRSKISWHCPFKFTVAHLMFEGLI